MNDQLINSYTEDEIKRFAPKSLENLTKEKSLRPLQIEVKEGKGAPFISIPILQDVPKQQFNNAWTDALDLIEKKLLQSGKGPFKIFCENPQDYRGVFMIKAWKE